MELLGFEDLGPSHPLIPINCPDLASTHPWPLHDYPTHAAAPFFQPFVSSCPSPASLLHCASPYLLFPSMPNLSAPPEFHGFYKPAYDCSKQHVYQEPCASTSMFSGVDSCSFSCPVYLELGAQSPRTPFSYTGVSSESKDGSTLQCCQDVKNLQVALPTHPTVLQNHVHRTSETAKHESHSVMTSFNNIHNSSQVSSSPEAAPVPVASTSSSLREAVASTTTSIEENDDAKCSSNQESQAEISATATTSNCKTHGAKRRKAQQKTVVCVPAIGGTDKPTGECLPSDSWAWRKYGQKPIKGSPYPRGYYRCSSSKGCTARKQVERSRSDPSMLVITYTSDHNHSWPTRTNRTTMSHDKRSPDSAAVSIDNTSELSDNIPFSSDINSPANIQEDQAISPTTASMDGDCVLEEQGLDLDFEIFHKQDDDFFAELEELPDCWIMLKRNPYLDENIADEEDGNNPTVDPYNLFSWSSNSCGEMNSIW